MHIYWIRDKNTCEFTHKLDLIGIVILIFGNAVSMVYYEFYCLPFYQSIYLTANALSACLVIYVMSCGAHFIRNSNWISAVIYSFQTLITFIPYFHWYRLR